MLNHFRDQFIAQSCQDAMDDYERSTQTDKSPCWDWVIVTASSRHQAEVFRLQIDRRRKEGFLPQRTEFAVVPDPDGRRVGSGGATLNVLDYLAHQEGVPDLGGKKVLLIHSGGDGKRVPQYSACGKLFMPVPKVLPNGKRSTVFDEIMVAFSGVPARVHAGILVVPSDTVVLFSPLQLDLMSCDAAGLSVKTSLAEGQEHGVYIGGVGKSVAKFLHKRSESEIRANGGVDGNDEVDIDTGCVWLGSRVVRALAGLICEGDSYSRLLLERFVNPEACLSFYADFLYPLAEEAVLEEYYREVPENAFTGELRDCREKIWEALRGFRMELARLMPAEYIHFGTTREVYDLVTKEVEKKAHIFWRKRITVNGNPGSGGTFSNCRIHPRASFRGGCYVEDSIIGENALIGEDAVLSGVTVVDEEVPGGVAVHCLRLKNGMFVCRIYGIDDNPKNSVSGEFLGTTLRRIAEAAGLPAEELCPGPTGAIWDAALYPECATPQEALGQALTLWKIAEGRAGEREVASWKEHVRYSLKSSFEQADIPAILAWQEQIGHGVHTKNFTDALYCGEPLDKALHELEFQGDSDTELGLIVSGVSGERFPMDMRLYYALSDLCRRYGRTVGGLGSQELEDLAYEAVKRHAVGAVRSRHPFDYDRGHFIRKEVAVELPARVNFCGSPSDAAPYCLEHGGTMLDGALLLKGKMPIRAALRQIEEPCFIFESADLKMKGVFREVDEVRSCSDPYDPFALHKAVLIAAGVVSLRKGESSLQDICRRLGGGLHLTTYADIPKGSGLGTSSIMAAACIKAVNIALGQEEDDGRIYAQVFAAEQLMSTGGGWQDQAGGLTPGIKLMHSRPGAYQEISIEHIALQDGAMQELKERFVLIFSGQRRLARSVLREEMNQCIKNDAAALEAVEQIRRTCILMKFELERGNITGFADYMTEQYELVKILDRNATNTCIEYIFSVCGDLLDGKSVCGAGGGGFLQAVLKKGATREMLRRRIEETFRDCGVELWDCELI